MEYLTCHMQCASCCCPQPPVSAAMLPKKKEREKNQKIINIAAYTHSGGASGTAVVRLALIK